MLLMMGEILKFVPLAKAFPDSKFLAVLAFHQSHVEWVGCSLHDLIQPSFTFLVGVSLPFSIAARTAKGQSKTAMTLHAFWRAFLLVWIGIVLRSLGRDTPDYGFTDVLSQIGLGYGFLFLLGLRPVRDQWIALAVILIGFWIAFAAWPLPPDGFDWTAVGVTPQWFQEHGLAGFAAHWNKNANVAAAFDVWFLNLFPRSEPFVFQRGGYQVLSCIPTLATMILGLLAGNVLKGDRTPVGKLNWLAMAGVLGLAAGYLLGLLGICPVVKRIWTPSWVLFSGGWCFLLLAGIYAAMDIGGWKRWAFPLTVVGMNSIAAYCMSTSFVKPEIHKGIRRHLGPDVLNAFGPEFSTLLHGALTLTAMWLILYWMYRRRVFIRV